MQRHCRRCKDVGCQVVAAMGSGKLHHLPKFDNNTSCTVPSGKAVG